MSQRLASLRDSAVDNARRAAPLDVPRARWGISLLIVVALYTAMDRQVIGLLAGPLRHELGIDDTQFGLLQGAGVILFAALGGYPLAWLADRIDRRLVLATCLAAWCLALAGCARATGFAELLLISSLMGAAEAGVIPIAYALIADWFGQRNRQAATSVFVLLGRLGAGAMVAASGWLVASVVHARPWLPGPWQGMDDWRLALLLTAVPGLLLVPMLLTMPAVPRTDAQARKVAADAAVLPALSALLPLMVGTALLASGAAAVAVFMPVLLQRLGDLSAAQAGSGLGAAALAAALVALAITTLLARRNPGRAQSAGGMRVAATGMAVAAVGSALLMTVSSHGQALLLYGCALGGTMTASMLLVGVMQAQAPAAARSRFMALFVGAAAVAAALSPIAVGAWSEAGGATPAALAQAMASIGAPCFAAAFVVLWWAAKRLAGQGT